MTLTPTSHGAVSIPKRQSTNKAVTMRSGTKRMVANSLQLFDFLSLGPSKRYRQQSACTTLRSPLSPADTSARLANFYSVYVLYRRDQNYIPRL